MPEVPCLNFPAVYEYVPVVFPSVLLFVCRHRCPLLLRCVRLRMVQLRSISPVTSDGCILQPYVDDYLLRECRYHGLWDPWCVRLVRSRGVLCRLGTAGLHSATVPVQYVDYFLGVLFVALPVGF